MRPSRHWILVGVGALVAFGSVAPGSAEPVSQSQKPNETDQAKPLSVAETSKGTQLPSAITAPSASQTEPSRVDQTVVPTAAIEDADRRVLEAQQPEPQPRSSKLLGRAPSAKSSSQSAGSGSAESVTQATEAAAPAPNSSQPSQPTKPASEKPIAAPIPTVPAQTSPTAQTAPPTEAPVPSSQPLPPSVDPAPGQLQPDPSPSTPTTSPSQPPLESSPTSPAPGSDFSQPPNVDPTRSTPATTPGQTPQAPNASGLTQFPYPSLPVPIPTPALPTEPLAPVLTPPQIGPASPGRAPRYLNPDPNVLQFPTRPEEVRLRGIQPITLLQAVELAERNNRNLQVQVETLRRSQAALEEQKAANYPTVGFQSSLTNSNSASGALSAARQQATLPNNSQLADPRASSALNGTLSLSYDLFTSGGRPARIRAAQQQLRSDELQVEITRETLRLDVANNYYDLQQADEAVRINLAAVRNNEISLRDAQALERAGLGTRFDVLRAEVQLANSRQDLTNSIAQQEIQRRQLAQRLSLPLTLDLAAADPVEIAGRWSLPLEDSIILAFKNRAELEQLVAQRELSEQQRKAALSAYGPSVTLSASYQFVTGINDDVGTRDGYSLSAGLNWNFFDGGAGVARARQQEANIAIAETQFADFRNQIRFDVEQAYFNLVSNLESIDTTTRALAQANEALRLARLRFQAGVGTQTDVINAETDLTRAEGNRVNAILGYNRALVSLLRAISNVRLAGFAPTTPAPTTPAPTTPAPTTPAPTTPAPTTP